MKDESLKDPLQRERLLTDSYQDRALKAEEENAILRKALEQIAGPDKPDTVPPEFRDYWMEQNKHTAVQIAKAALARSPLNSDADQLRDEEREAEP